MKREIKFRAWDGNKFDYAPTIWNGKVWNDAADCEIEGSTLMQFTGLKDKNGKEIYEGDVIQIVSTGDIKKVFYHKCAFGIDLGNDVFAPIYWHGDIEIIGNIYENPELL